MRKRVSFFVIFYFSLRGKNEIGSKRFKDFSSPPCAERNAASLNIAHINVIYLITHKYFAPD